LTSGQDHYPLQTLIQQFVVVIDSSNMMEDQYTQLNELSNQTLNAAFFILKKDPSSFDDLGQYRRQFIDGNWGLRGTATTTVFTFRRESANNDVYNY
jgi:hypothetical protein